MEGPVKPSFRHKASRFGTFALVLLASAGVASAQIGAAPPTIQDGTIGRGEINPPQWRLTDTQRGAIAAAVRHDKRAAEPSISFVPSVGAPVPPAIELYMLPDKILAEVPATRSVKYTVMKNQLVLVDPTTMRVVDIIPH
jgi:hypothetical protein